MNPIGSQEKKKIEKEKAYSGNKAPVSDRTPEMGCFRSNRTVQERLEPWCCHFIHPAIIYYY